jgi:hypothetical protein
MVDQMPELTTFMPNLRAYLLDFPKVRAPDVTSFIYWQDVQFGLKPTPFVSVICPFAKGRKIRLWLRRCSTQATTFGPR